MSGAAWASMSEDEKDRVRAGLKSAESYAKRAEDDCICSAHRAHADCGGTCPCGGAANDARERTA